MAASSPKKKRLAHVDHTDVDDNIIIAAASRPLSNSDSPKKKTKKIANQAPEEEPATTTEIPPSKKRKQADDEEPKKKKKKAIEQAAEEEPVADEANDSVVEKPKKSKRTEAEPEDTLANGDYPPSADVISNNLTNEPAKKKKKKKKENVDNDSETQPAATVEEQPPPPPPTTTTATTTNKFTKFDGQWFSAEDWRKLKQQQGLTIREGRYTKREDETLRAAVKEYLESKQLGQNELEEFLVNTKKQHKPPLMVEFWKAVGAALPERPLPSLYSHLRRLFHPGNHVGPWTAEEDEQLKQLVLEQGQRWSLIGEKMGRMATNCRDHYRDISVAKKNTGGWTDEENEALKAAVKKYSNGSETDIQWTVIAKELKTRTHHQCRTHWATCLNIREHKKDAAVKWTKEEDDALLDRLKQLGYDDESEIQWSFIPKGPLTVWGTAKCRERWMLLKKQAKTKSTSVPSAIAAIRKL